MTSRLVVFTAAAALILSLLLLGLCQTNQLPKLQQLDLRWSSCPILSIPAADMQRQVCDEVQAEKRRAEEERQRGYGNGYREDQYDYPPQQYETQSFRDKVNVFNLNDFHDSSEHRRITKKFKTDSVVTTIVKEWNEETLRQHPSLRISDFLASPLEEKIMQDVRQETTPSQSILSECTSVEVPYLRMLTPDDEELMNNATNSNATSYTNQTLHYFVKRLRSNDIPEDQKLGSIILLNGGPGQDGTALERFAYYLFQRMNFTYDIYIPDHRGTGRSNFLDCVELSMKRGRGVRPEDMLRCQRQLAEVYGRNLTGFTVNEAAFDTLELIQSIKQSQLTQGSPANIYTYAVSYGTYLSHRVLQLAFNYYGSSSGNNTTGNDTVSCQAGDSNCTNIDQGTNKSDNSTVGPTQDLIQGSILDGLCVGDSCQLGLWDYNYDAVGKEFLLRCQQDPYCSTKFPNSTSILDTFVEFYNGIDNGTLCPAVFNGSNSLNWKILFTSWIGSFNFRYLVPAIVYRGLRCTEDDQQSITNLIFAIRNSGVQQRRTPGRGSNNSQSQGSASTEQVENPTDSGFTAQNSTEYFDIRNCTDPAYFENELCTSMCSNDSVIYTLGSLSVILNRHIAISELGAGIPDPEQSARFLLFNNESLFGSGVSVTYPTLYRMGWSTYEAPPMAHEYLHSTQLPILLMNGDLDTQTPYATFARNATANLVNGTAALEYQGNTTSLYAEGGSNSTENATVPVNQEQQQPESKVNTGVFGNNLALFRNSPHGTFMYSPIYVDPANISIVEYVAKRFSYENQCGFNVLSSFILNNGSTADTSCLDSMVGLEYQHGTPLVQYSVLGKLAVSEFVDLYEDHITLPGESVEDQIIPTRQEEPTQPTDTDNTRGSSNSNNGPYNEEEDQEYNPEDDEGAGIGLSPILAEKLEKKNQDSNSGFGIYASHVVIFAFMFGFGVACMLLATWLAWIMLRFNSNEQQ